MEIIYRGYDVAETNHLAGNLVAAGLHPVTEQQDRTFRRGGRYFQWVIWLPADELSRAKPVLCEWQLAHDAKIKPDLQEIHRQVWITGLLGSLIVAATWLLAPKVFIERWGEFVTFSFILAGIVSILWNERRRRQSDRQDSMR